MAKEHEKNKELENIAEHFKGLPMGELIGAPLIAACDAQAMLAATTVKFIQDVCFEKHFYEIEGDDDKRIELSQSEWLAKRKRITDDYSDGNPTIQQLKDLGRFVEDYKIRSVPFSYKQYEENEDGHSLAEYKLEVPFISIINVLSLQVTDINIDFTMEVKSSFSETKKNDHAASMEMESELNLQFFSAKTKITGSVSSSKERQRKSDNSAKYQVSVAAKQLDPPEGLSRMLDMLNQCLVPVRQKPA